ncbi:MAG: ABC transporter ATP-binding protein [Gammaproteobacteria bacterium]|jgi:oligopeptide/dipeptide ABC transporter ATP-binding protein|nr:ABC transporter ATP-binding protein [Gammaproteobacteria bacterium]
MTDEVAKTLLCVRNLVVEFDTRFGPVRAVDDISFDIFPNETVGIVGESGCGKTVTGLSLLRLVPSPPGRIVQGSIILNGNDLVQLPENDMAQLRGDDISMIFQEPMTALNPVLSLGTQMTDVLRQHRKMTKREARNVAIDMLEKVGIPVPEKRIDEYPHELSGGMRQRVMIAMALSCNPKLLVADEPTTALDVTTQAQVLEQIVELQEEFHMAVILITHDLGVIAETCQRAIVMYCGNIVETGTVEDLFQRPRHPYTKGLLESIPRLRDERIAELPIIPGMVPDLLSLPPGCRFADRCKYAQADCLQTPPRLESSGDAGSGVACYHPLN